MDFILNLLIISSITAFLALVLEIADHFLADYGEKHILVNEEKDLLVQGGRPLLASLMNEDIFLPSACGGKGTCAYCKVRVHEGGGPVLPTETPYLNQEELESNMRLACQVKVKEDIKIEVPEELFLVRQFRARVKKITQLTPEIKEIQFSILEPEGGISFKPGQYVQLEVPKYKNTKSPEYRAYSICSNCEKHEELGLIITKAPGGAVSTYVHDYLKIDDELGVKGPFGDFYLKDSDRDILMIATGSGMAPIKSILHQMDEYDIPRKATFFFGAKTKEDLFFLQELEEFEKKIPGFEFIPTLSRSTEDDDWNGAKGRVTNLIEDKVPVNAQLDIYICGSPAVVESCLKVLKEKGIPEEQIYFDSFE